MKIGIDARNLMTGRNGIARYVEEMAAALVRADARVTLFLPEVPHPTHNRIKGASYRFIGGGLIERFVSQRLRAAVVEAACDVFWGPAHRLPSGLPKAVPALLTIHDMVWRTHPETMRLRGLAGEHLLKTAALSRASRIITLSASTRRDLERFAPQVAAPVVTIHPGVATPLKMLASTAQPGNDEARLAEAGIGGAFVLFVGTIEPRKNIARLISAFRALPESAGQLVLAGTVGWKSSAVVREIAASQGRIVHWNAPDDADIALLYRKCRFVALPSLHEGFGMPIIEAQTFGRAVLTSDAASMPEAAGDAAVLVDPLDTGSIHEGMRLLLEDQALLASLEARARHNAARFNWDQAAAELLAVAHDAKQAEAAIRRKAH